MPSERHTFTLRRRKESFHAAKKEDSFFFRWQNTIIKIKKQKVCEKKKFKAKRKVFCGRKNVFLEGKLKSKMEFYVSFHSLMFQFKIKTTREKKKKSKATKQVKTFLVLISLCSFELSSLLSSWEWSLEGAEYKHRRKQKFSFVDHNEVLCHLFFWKI